MKNTKLVLAGLGVLAVWLAVSPAAAQADTITYRIDWTLTSFTSLKGDTLTGLPAPTFVNVDSDTYHFTDGILRVPTSFGGMTASIFFSSYCHFNTCPGMNTNDFGTKENRKNFLDRVLVAEGTWGLSSNAYSFDSMFVMNGDFYYMPFGNGGGDSAVGTFTTTQVPESSSLFLLGFGLAGIVFTKIRKSPDFNTRLQS